MNGPAWIFLAAAAVFCVLFVIVLYDNATLSERLRAIREHTRAQTFQAKTDVNFESSELLSNGERQLNYVEQTTAKAGQKGHLEIPATIEVRLVPFEGASQYSITARFRYRIGNGRLQLGFVLERPDDIIRAAFLDVVDSVQEAISQTILRGVPK